MEIREILKNFIYETDMACTDYIDEGYRTANFTLPSIITSEEKKYLLRYYKNSEIIKIEKTSYIKIFL